MSSRRCLCPTARNIWITSLCLFRLKEPWIKILRSFCFCTFDWTWIIVVLMKMSSLSWNRFLKLAWPDPLFNTTPWPSLDLLVQTSKTLDINRTATVVRCSMMHVLQVGPRAESSPGVHESRSSQETFTPVSQSASLEGCHSICDSETEQVLKPDAIQSVQLAYPVSQQGRHRWCSSAVSAAPSFIVLPPHVPLDSLVLKITFKQHTAPSMLGSSLVFSHSAAFRHLESLRNHADVERSEQHQLRNNLTPWQECCSVAKVWVAFCGNQCLICISVICPCLFITTILAGFVFTMFLVLQGWLRDGLEFENDKIHTIVSVMCIHTRFFFVVCLFWKLLDWVAARVAVLLTVGRGRHLHVRNVDSKLRDGCHRHNRRVGRPDLQATARGTLTNLKIKLKIWIQAWLQHDYD